MELHAFTPLLLAVALGLLVGTQREWAADEVAGVRTFALITLGGAVCALLSAEFGGWFLAAGLVSVTALVVAANIGRTRDTPGLDHGITTEVAALVMFGVGALLAIGQTTLSVVVAGGLAVLLHFKQPLHARIERLQREDLDAIIRLTLIGLVILPVLPNRSFGPYAVLNPFQIWLMVVLIVGLSMAGYVAYALFGTRRGSLVSGLLGGLISSTATTVSYAKRTRTEPDRSPTAAVVVVLASVVVFGRVMVEIGVVAPSYLPRLAPPLVVMMAVMAVTAVVLLYAGTPADDPETLDRRPPSDLRAAVGFGALYAAVLLAVALTRQHLGDEALYAVAAVSGLTDVDAITLSSAQMVQNGGLEAATGWRLILVGTLSNLVFKGGVVAVLGDRRLRSRIISAFGVSFVAGVALLFLWPA
ncbi:MAG: MgtC/SapB family protein [Gemmatimonadetes bacterium]|nr:MgtC/SapB family protein [Gemmatimonadota bacterium]